jgi:L-lactate dehydrogenase complex protein LldF
MSSTSDAIPFRKNSVEALRNASLRKAMTTATDVFREKRAAGLASTPLEIWREKASEIRLNVVKNLMHYVDAFASAAVKAGAIVHRARDAEIAREIVGALLKDRGVKRIVKAKSMVTEEIHLNSHLERLGMEVVETDLGEYIVQIAGEPPSHILAPAIHKNRQDVGRLFAEKLGVDYSEDPAVLTKVARKALREKFISAEAGISGENFAVADTGSLVIFTNEGNGRMVTTLPPIHIAVFTLEKIIPSLTDLAVFARLLPRSATGQALSTYLSVITGPRRPGEDTGPKELHIVLLDNGRSEISRGEFREMLKCIRCSACINVCPVYRCVGGHAYGSTYPGPMGIVLTALLEGVERAHPLFDASTLCGACAEACPVKVPLISLFRRLRELKVEKGLTPAGERAAMAAFGTAVGSPFLFSFGESLSRRLWPAFAALGSGGVANRLPKPAKRPFRKRI